MEIPNLGGFADPQNVSQKGTGSFKASYINWARTLHDIRENAKGWMPEMIENVHGEQVHPAPDGSGYLMIRFRHVDGTTTTAIPHAIMDNRMHPVKENLISSRDVSDSFVRGACKCAAAVFGYAWQMWSKDDPMERSEDEEKEIEQLRKDRAEIKKGAIRQSRGGKDIEEKLLAKLDDEDVLNVGNDIVDQHSTPQDWLENNDPIAVQEPKSTWRDFVCPFPAHKGKTLGEIYDNHKTKGYLNWIAGLEEIKSEGLRKAIGEYQREENNNGRQGFNRIG